MPSGLTIVGLGPGRWESLTVEAAEILRAAPEVYVRTTVHPTFAPIADHLPDTQIRSFDALYEESPTLGDVYEGIARELARLARRPQGAVYAVPGSPSLGESSVRLILDRIDVPTRLVQGISHVEPVLEAVGASDLGWVEVIDAADMDFMSRESALGQVPGEGERLPFRTPVPTAPLIVSYLYDREIASGVKLWLSRFYPDGHLVRVVTGAGTSDCRIDDLPIYDLDRRAEIDHRTALFVPPLPEVENVRTFAGLMNLTRTLRAPEGCPWDREQTHTSLKPHLLEEAYEVIEALDAGDSEMLREELGDLLFQVAIHSQLAAEEGTFTIEDVIQGIMTKLIGRHPHVFDGLALESAQDVRNAWETFKQKEKPKRASVLQDIPRGLPALPQSSLIQKRAASVGFEWPSTSEVLDKVEEELEELRREVTEAAPKEREREEFGDILFALVSVARHLKIEPEEALRLANRKFAARFQYVESRVSAEGKTLRDLTPTELDKYWEEAKALGVAPVGHEIPHLGR